MYCLSVPSKNFRCRWFNLTFWKPRLRADAVSWRKRVNANGIRIQSAIRPVAIFWLGEHSIEYRLGPWERLDFTISILEEMPLPALPCDIRWLNDPNSHTEASCICHLLDYARSFSTKLHVTLWCYITSFLLDYHIAYTVAISIIAQLASGNLIFICISLNSIYDSFIAVITMSADPPQVVNTGIFARYQNVAVIDSQFLEVLHFSIFHLDLIINKGS